ncbi:condensation domain-containing protein, partial [Staphylococcus epidermidis]|uniref:condensation domain-containing protein n=1 Tax=Staphylococcus epidermidis TaxID=1282 RepID=UPI001E5E667D
FTKIIERHESLRTHFDTIDGEPVQIVHDTVNFQMEIEENYSSSYEELIGEFVRPFDLSEPSLIRVKLVKRDTNHY